MTTTQLPAAPSWATGVEHLDTEQPEGITIYRAAFGSLPRFDKPSFTRDGTLQLRGFQYNFDEGDLPAGTPTLELSAVDKHGQDRGWMLLTVDDAIALAGLLTQAVEKMTEARR